MSTIASLAVRLMAVRILKNSTLRAKVYDSALDPIGLIQDEDGKEHSIAIISSEDESGILNSRQINTGERTAKLLIEIAVGAVGNIEIEDGGTTLAFSFNPTSEVSEANLTVIQRQVMRELFGSTGSTANLFRKLVPNVIDATVKRGVPTEQGAKFAARAVEITFTPLHDPAFGEELAPVWVEFLAFVREQYGNELHDLLHATMTGGPIPVEAQAQVAAGLTFDEGLALRVDGF